MRIVTRPDFDGIVCAVLLYEVETIDQPIKWVSPNDMQKNRVEIKEGDIIANLPYNENCSLWFDHHFSNQLRRPVAGVFRIAPSAAGIVYEGNYEVYQILLEEYYKITGILTNIRNLFINLGLVLVPTALYVGATKIRNISEHARRGMFISLGLLIFGFIIYISISSLFSMFMPYY